MDSRKNILFFSGAVGWGILVMVLVIYLFFPYQKAVGMALQNMVDGGRASVSMDGVTMKLMGIKASRLLFRPDNGTGQSAPFELSNIDVLWNPLPLVKGKLTIYSKAAAYDGTLRCTIEGVPVMGPSNPNVSVKLEHVNIGKCPEGVVPWFRSMSGILDGTIDKEVPVGKPDGQIGSFRFTVRNGEIRDLQVKNMPRLIVPYKEIDVEGKIDGQKIAIKRLTVTGDVISMKGTGVVESGESDRVDLKLAYEVLSGAFPIQGKGLIAVSGNQAAPVVTITFPNQEKPANGAPH
ncbi:MAG: type II secretion system protein GspN [Syntrophorhabdales bacterium]|jgi:type II secretion system protein N